MPDTTVVVPMVSHLEDSTIVWWVGKSVLYNLVSATWKYAWWMGKKHFSHASTPTHPSTVKLATTRVSHDCLSSRSNCLSSTITCIKLCVCVWMKELKYTFPLYPTTLTPARLHPFPCPLWSSYQFHLFLPTSPFPFLLKLPQSSQTSQLANEVKRVM